MVVKHLSGLIVLVAGVGLSSGCAWWQERFGGEDTQGAQQPVSFQSLDTDGDGMISRDEAQQREAVAERFQSLDTDADGNLSQAEFAAFEAQGGGSY